MSGLFDRFDDLRVVSSRAPDPDAMTLCAIGRNEMYFLPAFLKHYRALGVEQFAILDDRSTDGMSEYLMEQPDVVVLESDYSYGDTIDLPQTMATQISAGRILYVWRSLLFSRFATQTWGVQTDLDEFVCLPDGMRFQDVAKRLDGEGARLAHGLMLDVYPATLGDMKAMSLEAELDPGVPVYFDGEAHLRLRDGKSPKTLHPGARARLYHEYGVSEDYARFGFKTPDYPNALVRAIKTRFGTRIPNYNTICKPLMAKWPAGAFFRNSHHTNLHGSTSVLVPFLHYRFTGALYRKIEVALREKSYSSGSLDHRLLEALLQRMSEGEGGFRYRKSRLVDGFAGLRETGNAKGL